MHPALLVPLVDDRLRELHAQAAAGRATAGLPVVRPVRDRAGWWLVELGLRLALGREAGARQAAAYHSPAPVTR